MTLAVNRAVFKAIRFRARTLVDISGRSQKVTLFGRTYASPFGIAPTGAAGLYCFEADLVLARATEAAGGEAGIRHALETLRTEVDRVLSLTGCPDMAALSRDYLQLPQTPHHTTGEARRTAP